MAFGLINTKVAKMIAANAPKYRRIVEPFGDGGTFALHLEKRRPAEHVVNFEDEMLFALMTFIQQLSAADRSRLKSFDWTGSEETFDKVVAIAATEGAEFFYRYFYLKEFGIMGKDMAEPPMFDWLRRGEDMRAMLYELPVTKIGLRNTTLVQGDPMALVQSGGADTFLILLPVTPEQAAAVEGRLGSISSPFFYARKSGSNEALAQSIAQASGNVVVSSFSAASIMMATMEVRTNYPNKLPIVGPDPAQLSADTAGAM